MIGKLSLTDLWLREERRGDHGLKPGYAHPFARRIDLLAILKALKKSQRYRVEDSCGSIDAKVSFFVPPVWPVSSSTPTPLPRTNHINAGTNLQGKLPEIASATHVLLSAVTPNQEGDHANHGWATIRSFRPSTHANFKLAWCVRRHESTLAQTQTKLPSQIIHVSTSPSMINSPPQNSSLERVISYQTAWEAAVTRSQT
jgi:hypothetical protein